MRCWNLERDKICISCDKFPTCSVTHSPVPQSYIGRCVKLTNHIHVLPNMTTNRYLSSFFYTFHHGSNRGNCTFILRVNPKTGYVC